jgi:hypothetical protein
MNAQPSPRVQLTPVHLVRAGSGLDAVRLRARGIGLVFGTFGARWVRGEIDAVIVRRFPGARCRAVFVGLGVGWASVRLGPVARLDVPQVAQVEPPRVVEGSPMPDVSLHLTVTPPELP